MLNKVMMVTAAREAYGVEDVAEKTMTVGELISFLSDFDEDTKIVLSHDGGYTYGALTEERFDTEDYYDKYGNGDPETVEQALDMIGDKHFKIVNEGELISEGWNKDEVEEEMFQLYIEDVNYNGCEYIIELA